MSIDPQTGRYCLPCSIDLRWRMADIAGALDGLPPEETTKGQPITDLLCGYHRYQFLNIPLNKQEIDPQTGREKRYPNGEPSLVVAGYFPRAFEGMHYHLAQKDLLTLLENMEQGLRLLDATRRRAQLMAVICDEPTVVLPSAQELLTNSHLHAQIYDFLASERDPKSRDSSPFPHNMTLMDFSDDDRSSGEE